MFLCFIGEGCLDLAALVLSGFYKNNYDTV